MDLDQTLLADSWRELEELEVIKRYAAMSSLSLSTHVIDSLY